MGERSVWGIGVMLLRNRCKSEKEEFLSTFGFSPRLLNVDTAGHLEMKETTVVRVKAFRSYR